MGFTGTPQICRARKNLQGRDCRSEGFNASLVMRNDVNGGKYLYDIVDIKQNSTSALVASFKGSTIASPKGQRYSTASTDSISENSEKDNEYSDSDIKFPLRTKESPKKIQIGYKVFAAKECRERPKIIFLSGSVEVAILRNH